MRSDEELDVEVVINWQSSLKELLLVKTSEGFKKETVKNYKTGINDFSSFCISEGIKEPSKVSRALLRHYLTGLKQKHHASYCNSRLSQIRVYYDFLIQEEYLTEYQDPTRRVKFMPKEQKLLVVFNDSEVQQMITEASNQKNKFHAERDKLMIMIMADCGLRVNELVNLKDKNVTTESIFVDKAKGRKQRMLYVTAPVAQQIIKYRRIRDGYFRAKHIPKNQMFFRNFRGESMKNDGVQKIVKRIGLKCNIRGSVRVSPHTFRHWFAQSQLNNGISIFTLSKLLGHESINTTQGYLRGLADESIIQSAITTSPLLNIKNKN
ncbi:tyrosine-type recombinase/integrase [uncultured Enterococcus sp.]|uniref:tyrosine-type recombinase/integrase n=1 Tax=uncultured Enterococcus sp. TaxID=167972 RepID=UPI002805CFE0|nr:tyrosine-type recombinase/integrase [uncultured Enterococcus sp.]